MLLLLSLFFLSFLPATKSLTQLFPRATPNRNFILSTRSPLTASLTPASRSALTAQHGLIATLSTTLDGRITHNDTISCNLRGAPWITRQLDDLQHLQLGLLDRTCQSRLSFSSSRARRELPASFLARARAVLRRAADAGEAAVRAFVRTDPRWGAVYAVSGWDIVKTAQRCTIETGVAYRVNATWYVRVVATNHPVDAFVPEGERLYVQEFVPAHFGHALSMVHPNMDGVLVNGTTLLVRQGGQADFSSIAMGDAENPALEEALRLNEIAVDQAQDAVTPSNVAILALPMVMALIPVAFVAELNTFATILYIVFTDIFSALPFLIKGVELTTASVVNRGELVAFHLGTVDLGVLEVWAAQCHGEDSFRNLGIAFIVTASAAMILGVAFEVFAWKHMRRKGRSAQGPFGNVFRVDPYTLMMRTGDDGLDGEQVVEEETRRWRVRWKGFRRQRPVEDVDDMH